MAVTVYYVSEKYNPYQATPGSKVDLYAKDVTINHKKQKAFYELDFRGNTQGTGSFIMIALRSSIGKYGDVISLANGVGIIDMDYTGPYFAVLNLRIPLIKRIMFKLGFKPKLDIPKPGERIAQLLVMPNYPISLIKLNSKEELEKVIIEKFAYQKENLRFENGYGSTGKN